MDQSVAIRRAYARSIMLAIRTGGHAVNVDDLDQSTLCERLSWLATAVAKALRALMAETGVAAPTSFYELEVCAGTPDVVCGSDFDAVDADLLHLYTLATEALNDVLEAVVDEPELLALLGEFPTNDLLEASWAA